MTLMKRRMSFLVLLAFCFSLLTPIFAVPTAIADTDGVQSMVNEMSVVYPYLSSTDKSSIDTARSNLAALAATPGDTRWDSIIDPLLTTEVVNAFGSEAAARQEMIDFAVGLGEIYYSDTESEVYNTLNSFKNDFSGSFALLFGSGITVEDLYGFLANNKAQLPGVVEDNTSDAYTLAFGTDANYVITMHSLVQKAMDRSLDSGSFNEFRGKLTAIGWSTQDLVDQQVLLADEVDPGNSAEIALGMAAMRSQTKLYEVNSTGTVLAPTAGYNGTNIPFNMNAGEIKYFKLEMMNNEFTDYANWANSNASVTMDSGYSGGDIIKVTAVSSGTTTISSYRKATGATAADDWLLKFNVVVSGNSSTITPTSATFDKSAQADVTTTMTLNGNTLTSISNGATPLVQNTDYTVSGNVVTIKKSYLAARSDGTTTLTFTFSAGITRDLSITVSTGGGGGGGGGAATPSYKVGPDGTTITAGNLSILVPADAVGSEIAVFVAVMNQLTGLSFPTDWKVVSDIVSITKLVAKDFNKPVTITLKYDKTKITDDMHLSIYWWDDTNDKWVELDNVVVKKLAGTVSGQVTHFTKFAVIASPATPTKPPVNEQDTGLKDIKGHWAEANINKLVASGAISGYKDGTFLPEKKITRAEFATILIKALKLEAKAGKVFPDTKYHWAKNDIATAQAYGIITGYDNGKFGPDDPITREQMASMIVKAGKLVGTTGAKSFADDNKIAKWAQLSVRIATASKVMGGYQDNTFRPKELASRAEAVTVIINTLTY